jgi:serine/threonine protein kinase
MFQDLETICQQIEDAYHPEDLFGVKEVLLPPKMSLTFLQQEYQIFRSQLDPFLTDIQYREQASEALMKLDALFRNAQNKIERFHYGLWGFNSPRPRTEKSFTIGTNRYFVGHRLSADGTADVFQGFLEHNGEYVGEVEIKRAASIAQNHLLQREARALDILHKDQVAQWKHLPFILDRFDSAGQIGLIFRKSYGLTLTEVRKRRAQMRGIDQKHIAWMLDRCLSALGYIHRTGLVNGSITPDTIVIDDRLHNATFIDWSASAHNPARTGERVELRKERNNPFVAPEVLSAGEIGPWSDIYALGKTMIWCLGGDPSTNSIPQRVESEMQGFLRRMVHEDHMKRSSDCWELYDEQCRIKDSLWPRQFQHLDVS